MVSPASVLTRVPLLLLLVFSDHQQQTIAPAATYEHERHDPGHGVIMAKFINLIWTGPPRL